MEDSEGEESGEEGGDVTYWGELSVFGSCSQEWGREVPSSPAREAPSSPAPQLPTSTRPRSSEGEAEVPDCRGVRKLVAFDINMMYEGASRGVVQEEQLDDGHMEEGGELQEVGLTGGDMEVEVEGLILEKSGLLGGCDGDMGENWRMVQEGGELLGASYMEEEELEGGDTRSLPVTEGGFGEEQGGGLQRLEEGMLGFVRDVDDEEDISGGAMQEGEGDELLQDLDLLLESLAQEPGQNVFTGQVAEDKTSSWSPATDRGELGASLVTAADRSSPAGSSGGLEQAGDSTELCSPEDGVVLRPAGDVIELSLHDVSSLLSPEISPAANNPAPSPAEEIQALSAHSSAENTPAHSPANVTPVLGPAEFTPALGPAADFFMQHWKDSIEQLAAVNPTLLSPAGNSHVLSPAAETETRIQEDAGIQEVKIQEARIQDDITRIQQVKIQQEAKIQDDATGLRVRSRGTVVGSWDTWVVERREAECWRCLGEAGEGEGWDVEELSDSDGEGAVEIGDCEEEDSDMSQDDRSVLVLPEMRMFGEEEGRKVVRTGGE